MARCPAHDDRKPSLSLNATPDGRMLVHCHAGCGQAQVIAALRARGLWGAFSSEPAEERGELVDVAERTRRALWSWHFALEASDPKARQALGTYFGSREIELETIPPALRFHPGLRHPAGAVYPAMVALVTRGVDDEPLGVHRTFIARDGKGKAPVEPAKMLLGPCRGGAVRLGGDSDVLMVGEGIETCLAAMVASGHRAWAALSAPGLKALELPIGICEVIVLADGDDAGEAAALDCATRFGREGRRVSIARPSKGMDFADLLKLQVGKSY